VRRLALFHYDQDYSDRDVDQMFDRSRRSLEQRRAQLELFAAAEGLTLRSEPPPSPRPDSCAGSGDDAGRAVSRSVRRLPSIIDWAVVG
jgi:hypothetical protein